MIYTTIPSLTSNMRTRHKKVVIQNPTPLERWFFYITHTNIPELERLLKNNIKIDSIDEEGNTIAHHALYRKSRKLINFCHKNKADFKQENINHEQPDLIVFENAYSLYLFKKIISTYSSEYILNSMKDAMFMCVKNDKNLKKLHYLLSYIECFPQTLRNDLAQYAFKCNAQENWFFLSGKSEFMKKLNQLRAHDAKAMVKI